MDQKKIRLMKSSLAPAVIACSFFCFSPPVPAAGSGELQSKNTASQSPAACRHNRVLTWDAPMKNTNGGPLEELAGYTIHYGGRSGRYDKKIKIPLDDEDLYCKTVPGRKKKEPAATRCRYVVFDLDHETRYFAVKAYDRSGSESDFSNEVSK